jgi:hypothetical protein
MTRVQCYKCGFVLMHCVCEDGPSLCATPVAMLEKETKQLRSDLFACLDRCDAFEWLVEVLNLWFTFSEPWGPRKAYYNVAYRELAAIRKSAIAAVEGKQ